MKHYHEEKHNMLHIFYRGGVGLRLSVAANGRPFKYFDASNCLSKSCTVAQTYFVAYGKHTQEAGSKDLKLQQKKNSQDFVDLY